jgi:hypothetical protein
MTQLIIHNIMFVCVVYRRRKKSARIATNISFLSRNICTQTHTHKISNMAKRNTEEKNYDNKY